MILEEETLKKFYISTENIPKFGKQPIIIKCDICGSIFEKPAIQVFTARRNSNSIVDICTNIQCIKKKRENTMLKKYGVINAGLSNEIRKRVQLTCLKKYGVKEAMMSDKIKQKSQESCLKKYGVKSISQIKWVKDKIKATTLKNYGVEYSMQSPIVKQLRENNNLKKYGVKNPMMLKSISSKTSETQKDKIYNELLKNKDVIPTFTRENFYGFKNPSIKFYKFKCVKCGNEFENNYIGVKCYKCNPLPRSNIEEELKKFISENYKGIIKNNCRKEFNNEFEIDVFLPEIKVALELNGNYYHSELYGNKDKKYHLIKTEKCENMGIRLIQIFEDEWINKKEIVKQKILHLLKIKLEKSIFARKCKIKNIFPKDANDFLNQHHIQGSCQSSIQLGAYNNENLISVMTFGKLRRITGSKPQNNNIYEMIRFATSKNTVGIAGKFLNYFIKTYKPKTIISYADRRWTFYKNNLYEKINFKKVSDGTPNYWYVHKTNFNKRFHRFIFRKSELSKKLKTFDPNLTEWENMKNNGWDRIWDCGNLKYEMTF